MSSREVNGVLIPDAETRKALKAKARAGMLPPQSCPKCGADLSDPTVPDRYREYKETFGLAKEILTAQRGIAVWECPPCGHRWQRHVAPASLGRRR